MCMWTKTVCVQASCGTVSPSCVRLCPKKSGLFIPRWLHKSIWVNICLHGTNPCPPRALKRKAVCPLYLCIVRTLADPYEDSFPHTLCCSTSAHPPLSGHGPWDLLAWRNPIPLLLPRCQHCLHGPLVRGKWFQSCLGSALP